MHRYVVRRIALAIPTVFIVMVVVFSITRLVPGDAVDVLISQGGFYATDPSEMRKELGLDEPVLTAFLSWTGGVLRGDLGRSLFTQEPVRSMLTERFRVTAELGLLSIVFGIAIALPVGVLSAVKQNTVTDYAARGFAVLGLSMPSFWVGTIVVLYGAVWFGWAPPLRLVPLTRDPVGNLEQFAIPAAVIGVHVGAVIMRMLRSMLLEALREDYVRTARAKGLSGRRVVVNHALRNALLPVVTVLGLQVAFVFSGTVVNETIFNLPGLGTMVVDAVARRDYPVIQGVVLFVAVLIIIVNLAVDLSYAYLDPRVRVDQ